MAFSWFSCKSSTVFPTKPKHLGLKHFCSSLEALDNTFVSHKLDAGSPNIKPLTELGFWDYDNTGQVETFLLGGL